jgi:2-polyprenyl-3-methyl-5-hydroxy-6-metoxy-1,4-benzoquinol methylase
MEEISELSGYHYDTAALNNSHRILLPAVVRKLELLARIDSRIRNNRNIFELGCGNGSVAWELTQRGWQLVGVDPSTEGIALAHQSFPSLQLRHGSAYEELSLQYGQFPIVLSLEVVEHLYFPRRWAATMYSLTAPGGVAVASTPYHGYWKNLALAVSGRLDAHFTALSDHGHIKFWSIKTLSLLLQEAGFENIRIERVGRLPPIAKSMLAVARRPF